MTPLGVETCGLRLDMFTNSNERCAKQCRHEAFFSKRSMNTILSRFVACALLLILAFVQQCSACVVFSAVARAVKF